MDRNVYAMCINFDYPQAKFIKHKIFSFSFSLSALYLRVLLSPSHTFCVLFCIYILFVANVVVSRMLVFFAFFFSRVSVSF